MDRLDVMRLFLRVVEQGSFSKAARAAGLGQPTVSKQIASLEARLKVQLLRRSSRGLSLTEAGQGYYDSAVRLLDEFDAAEARASGGEGEPRGHIRVASSAAFGRLFIVPRLPEFLARYPGITVDFDISERHADLVADGIDVAIRIGRLSDSSLIARRIGSVDMSTVATPDYLARHGAPTRPDDLADLPCVVFLFDGAPRPWQFTDPATGQVLTVPPRGVVRSNDAEHIRAAVLAGIGIGHNAGWLFAADIAAGAVRPVLEGFKPPLFPIHAVSPGARLTTGKLRVFIDFLADICAREDSLKLR